MSKLYCVCCGSEITSKDRFCLNCGENNEDYIEVIETKVTTSNIINQPINKVPINPLRKAKAISNDKVAILKTNPVDYRKNSNRLQEFEELSNMIYSLNDNRLKEYENKLEEKFIEQDELFYLYCGKLLERLLKKIKYDKSSILERKQTTYEMFCLDLDRKFYLKNIDYMFLKSKNIYLDWMKKYTKKNGTEYSSFKADFTDILLKTNLIDNRLMYSSFIDDVFNLYSLRTSVNHDDDNSINIRVNKDSIIKLNKIVLILLSLI